MITIREKLIQTVKYLDEQGISSPALQAEQLFCDVLQFTRAELYLDDQRRLCKEEQRLLELHIERRGKGEPLAYINGFVSFFGCHIDVNSDVLIPRQETEILVENVVNELRGKESADLCVWDLCCGSGCIGIAIKKALPEVEMILSDISEEAIVVAKQNAKKNQVEVEFRQGALFSPFSGERADVIVCNPPYISQSEYDALDQEVSSFEPKLALYGGEDGLLYFRQIAVSIKNYLKKSGRIWFEIGSLQGSDVKKIFKNAGFSKIEIEKDWAGLDRFVKL